MSWWAAIRARWSGDNDDDSDATQMEPLAGIARREKAVHDDDATFAALRAADDIELGEESVARGERNRLVKKRLYVVVAAAGAIGIGAFIVAMAVCHTYPSTCTR